MKEGLTLPAFVTSNTHAKVSGHDGVSEVKTLHHRYWQAHTASCGLA